MYKIQVRQSRVYSLEIQLSINVSSFNAKSKEMKNTTSLFSSLLHSNQPITATMRHLSMQKLKEMKNTTSFFLLYYTVINRPITANHYLYFGETRESKTRQSFLHPFKLNTGYSEFVLKKTKDTKEADLCWKQLSAQLKVVTCHT